MGEGGQGITIWELAQDRMGLSYSLLDSMHAFMSMTYGSPMIIAVCDTNGIYCAIPDLGPDLHLCEQPSIDLAPLNIVLGLDMNSLFISGAHLSRIFHVGGGTDVALQGLTLQQGFAFNNGGAIFNEGTLRLQNMGFEGNHQGLTDKALTNSGIVHIREGAVIVRKSVLLI